MKSQPTKGSLRRILSIENQQDQWWIKLDDLVSVLDLYNSTHYKSPGVNEAGVEHAALDDENRKRSPAAGRRQL